MTIIGQTMGNIIRILSVYFSSLTIICLKAPYQKQFLTVLLEIKICLLYRSRTATTQPKSQLPVLASTLTKYKHLPSYLPFLFIRKKCNAIGQERIAIRATAATCRKGAVTLM